MLSSRFARVARTLTSTSSSHLSSRTCAVSLNDSVLETSTVFRRDFSGDRSSGMPDVFPTALFRGRQLESTLLGDLPDFPTVTPFGTLRHPALIYSRNSQRIVGCVGGENLKHRLLWFQLKEGKKHVCSECGQVFKLVNTKTYKDITEIADERSGQFFNRYKSLVEYVQKEQKAEQTQGQGHGNTSSGAH